MTERANGDLAQWSVPPGWAWATVEQIGTVALGRQRSPVNHFGPHMRPYVRAANITWNGWDLTDVKEMNFDEADFARFRLSPGDVVVNEGSGSAKEVGKPAIWQGQIADCCFQNTLIRVQPTKCSPEYLCSYFLFSALTERFVSSTQGVNIYHIGKDGLSKFGIPVPPRPEQRRIVEKIDGLSAKSKRARENLDHIPRLVEKYKQAVLAAAFRGDLTREWRRQRSDPVWAPTNVGSLLTDIRYGTAKKCSYEVGAVPVLRIPNVQLGRITVDDMKFADFDPKEIKKLRLDAGDVLVIRSNGSLDLVGRSAVVGKAEAGMLFAGYLIRLRPHPELLDPDFLHMFLTAPETRAEIENLAKSTSGVNNVNSSQLQGLEMARPEMDEQREIVRLVDRAFSWIDRLAHEAGSARTLVDRLDQAVLAKAFRGELVPQDPSDEPASALLERIKADRAGERRPARGANRRRSAGATR